MKKTQTLSQPQASPESTEENYYSYNKNKEEPAQEGAIRKIQNDKNLFKIFIF